MGGRGLSLQKLSRRRLGQSKSTLSEFKVLDLLLCGSRDDLMVVWGGASDFIRGFSLEKTNTCSVQGVKIIDKLS